MGQRAILRGILREAVASGELAPTSDIDGLSWHFLGVLHATMNLPQAGATSGELRRVVELAMLAWPSAPPLRRRDCHFLTTSFSRQLKIKAPPKRGFLQSVFGRQAAFRATLSNRLVR